jgi:hypothetical protein
MRINIEVIPHEQQRYPTVGDYWMEDGVQQVRVSHLPDWRYEILVAVHEIVELAITRHRGIPEGVISEFDVEFEKLRESRLRSGEPGDHPDSPYRREHFFATNLERLLAGELDVNWFAYEEYVDGLGIKK